MPELRPYQRDAIDALYGYWQRGGGNPLIEIPTGGGKSLILSTICQELLAQWPTLRIGIVTHVKELVQQNAQELLSVWRSAPLGIYSAGLGRRDMMSQIMFMGIQSVHNKAKIVGPFDVLIVDEVHLVPRSSDTMYGRFIEDLRDMTTDMRIIGLTATPFRLDSGRLDKGDDRIFHDIIYSANVADLIEDGYLSPLISKATLARIDTNGLHRRGGEYVQSEMDERARIPTLVEAAVEEIVQLGEERGGWLAFCTSVAHSIDVRDAIRRHGFTCESVTGDTPSAERDDIIRRFKAKQIRALTSVGVLTTGFNAPHVDLLALLRPTLSTGLYVQMVGRAFRLAPGKDNALILDFAGNVMRHGPVDAVKPKKQGGAKKEPAEDDEKTVKAKECPTCRTLTTPYAKECMGCGHVWADEAPPHEARAQNVAILTGELRENDRIEISRTKFARHQKKGSPDSLRVVFTEEFGPMQSQDYSQWVCLEHGGFAGEKARQWWVRMGGQAPAPGTITEALTRVGELKRVVGIEIDRKTKYPEIKRVHFGPKPPDAPEPRIIDRSLDAWIDEDIPF